MGRTVWEVIRRLLVALFVLSGWIGVLYLGRDIAELPEVLRELRALVPFTQTTALIWFSGFLALWVIWIDLRPLILPVFRGRWRRRRLYEVEWVQAQEADSGGAARLWELRCRVRFLKDANNVPLVIRVRSCIGTGGEHTNIASSRILPGVLKDERLVIRFGSIWIPAPGWEPRHDVWGENLSGGGGRQEHIIHGCNNVVEISLGRQPYRIFATTPSATGKPWAHILLTISEEEAPALLSRLGSKGAI